MSPVFYSIFWVCNRQHVCCQFNWPVEFEWKGVGLLQAALDTSYWTAINHFFIWGSIGIFFVFTFALHSNALFFLSPSTFPFNGELMNKRPCNFANVRSRVDLTRSLNRGIFTGCCITQCLWLLIYRVWRGSHCGPVVPKLFCPIPTWSPLKFWLPSMWRYTNLTYDWKSEHRFN